MAMRWRRDQLQKLVLVPYRPFRNVSLGIGGVMLLIAVGLGAFYFGQNYGMRLAGATPEEVGRLRETVRLYAVESQRARDAAAVVVHDRDIVVQATEQLRQENKNLLTNIATLEQQVALYKRLLSPQGGQLGLSIERLDIGRGNRPGEFQLKLLLTQVNAGASEISGSVQAKVVGLQAGRPRTIDLALPGSPFRFQYFQDFRLTWQAPPGFVPERIDVIAQARGRPRVEKKFKWELSAG